MYALPSGLLWPFHRPDSMHLVPSWNVQPNCGSSKHELLHAVQVWNFQREYRIDEQRCLHDLQPRNIQPSDRLLCKQRMHPM